MSAWPSPLDLAELWNYRELALALVRKDVSVRYKQTVIGIAWAVVQPLLAALVFVLLFVRFAHLPTAGLPSLVFTYSGTTIWVYFSSSVMGAAQSLVDNRDLVTKVYFPRLVAPVAAIVSGLIGLGISLVILAVLMAIERVAPGLPILLLPAWILAAVAVALATGLWLSALNVKYRDVKQLLPFLLQLWLFASPVAYSSSIVTGDWRYLYFLNPLVVVLDGFRWSLGSSLTFSFFYLLSAAVGLVLLATGAVYFRRVERHFADVI